MVLGIVKIGLRLRDWHAFMWQSLDILNVFNTLTLNQIFWKMKTFLKRLDHCFDTKLPCQKPMLRKMKWGVQNGPIKRKEVLPVILCFCFVFENFVLV